MKSVRIRDLVLETGKPKIAVPITGKTKDEIKAQAKILRDLPADLCEWRVDCYEDCDSIPAVLDVLSLLKAVLRGMPLLFTFRSLKEGGQKDINEHDYEALLLTAAVSGDADLIDVELFYSPEGIERLIGRIHEFSIPVIASSHDFEKTPDEDEMMERLLSMNEAKADLLKLAVMPESFDDVLSLLSVSTRASHNPDLAPVVTMSMSELGLPSRLLGRYSGSVLTFGTAQEASAPGQIDCLKLKSLLQAIEEASQE